MKIIRRLMALAVVMLLSVGLFQMAHAENTLGKRYKAKFDFSGCEQLSVWDRIFKSNLAGNKMGASIAFQDFLRLGGRCEIIAAGTVITYVDVFQMMSCVKDVKSKLPCLWALEKHIQGGN
jgi:hypothetical protein